MTTVCQQEKNIKTILRESQISSKAKAGLSPGSSFVYLFLQLNNCCSQLIYQFLFANPFFQFDRHTTAPYEHQPQYNLYIFS
jgi:hypothetical protein